MGGATALVLPSVVDHFLCYMCRLIFGDLVYCATSSSLAPHLLKQGPPMQHMKEYQRYAEVASFPGFPRRCLGTRVITADVLDTPVLLVYKQAKRRQTSFFSLYNRLICVSLLMYLLEHKISSQRWETFVLTSFQTLLLIYFPTYSFCNTVHTNDFPLMKFSNIHGSLRTQKNFPRV